MFSDYKVTLDKLRTRIKNFTSLVEGMVVCPQPHYKGPLTVPSVSGRLVDLIEEQVLDVVPVSNNHVTRRSNESQRGSDKVRATPTGPPASPTAVGATPASTSTVPSPVRRPPSDPDEQQALLDYSTDLNDTNDGSVIERR